MVHFLCTTLYISIGHVDVATSCHLNFNFLHTNFFLLKIAHKICHCNFEVFTLWFTKFVIYYHNYAHNRTKTNKHNY